MAYEKELDFARNLAKRSGEVMMKYYSKISYIPLDEHKDIVIELEIEIDSLVKKEKNERFPTHGIFTEESGAAGLEKEFVWISDSIDGTINFVREKEHFATSLALMRNKEPIVGVIYLPYFEREFFAYKDGGAYRNSSPIKVSNVDSLIKSIVHIETNFHRHPENIRVREALTEKTGRLHALNTAAIELAYVAAGQSEALVSYSRLTDVAAGALLVQEAGGGVTDINGEPFTLESKSIIASNGEIHAGLVDLLKEV